MTQPTSRRTFLRSATLGAAVAGVAATTPSLFAGSADAATIPTATGAAAAGPVTAYVRDQATGEIAVMSGETEIILHDRALAKHLATLAARADRA